MEELKEFVAQRPAAKGAFGYGSGVFKQSGYANDANPQRDVIFIVDDLKEWHLENMDMNPKDYSPLGKLHLTTASKKRIKGLNKITYVSQIKSGDYKYKYGVIEESDFVYNLTSWENLFVVGRFQKPTLKINSTRKIDAVISYDQNCAFRIACLLAPSKTTLSNLFRILCGLSYMGDTRMKVAENPNKVFNIVKGSYSLLEDLYLNGKDYIQRQGQEVIIDHQQLLRELFLLPSALVNYFAESGTNLQNLEMVRKDIFDFISNKNKKESLYQTVDVIRTNGIVRSVPYVLSKVKKRINGK